MLRIGGLAATTLLAAGAYLAGALPDDRTPTPLGVLVWLAGAVLLAVVWWRARGMVTDLRQMLVTGAVWTLPLLVAPPLGSRDVYAYACQGALLVDGHDPYLTGAGAGGCPWVQAVPALWQDTTTPYGPLAVATSAVAAGLARATPLTDQGQLLVAVGLLRLVALIGILLMTVYAVRLARMSTVDPASAAWLGVVTPVVAMHAVSGAHNDALLAGLLLAALGVARRTVLGAGALLGLAVAVKVTGLVVLPFVVLLAAGTGAWPAVIRAAVRVGAAAVSTFALLSLLTGLDLGWLRGLARTGELVQWTSVPTGVGMAVGYLGRVLGFPGAYAGSVAVARVLGLGLLLLLLVVVWWRARRAAESARTVLVACGVALAAVALLSPVFYPWYAIAPLAVLACSLVDTRVRRWLAVATIVLSLLVLPHGLGIAVRTKLPGALLDLLLVVGLALWWWRRRSGRWGWCSGRWSRPRPGA